MSTTANYFIDPTDIQKGIIPKIDLHLHTKWTDGQHRVEEMYQSAAQKGLSTILFSEHVRQSSQEWFSRFANEVKTLPQNPCKALVGLEARACNFQGDLDCSESLMDQCDLIIGSVHRFPDPKGQPKDFDQTTPEEAEEIEFELSLKILENSRVDILGHPFGMCYQRYHRIPSEKKIRTLIEKAAQHQVAFEINTHYHPHPWLLILWCQEANALLPTGSGVHAAKEKKVMISLGSDAHSIDEIGRVQQVLARGESI